MADFEDLLKTRRSIRDFEEKNVSTEIVKELIKDSCLAPNAGNRQPWQFIIVNDQAVIKKISNDSKKNLVADIEQNPASPMKAYEGALRNPTFNIFYNAPCLVYFGGIRGTRSLQIDCTLAASYFMFTASNRGLGTCWIGLGNYIQSAELLKSVGAPEDFEIVAPIIIGYPKSIPEIPPRNEPTIFE